jgi:N-carbamoylputrescine amidase
MRVTVCELPHESTALDIAWAALCEHATQLESELVLLPEFAMVEPVWEYDRFDLARWSAAEQCSERWIRRFGQLGVEFVVATRPAHVDCWRYNQGFLWSAERGAQALRSKRFLPDEPNGREAVWFDRGHPDFPEFCAGELSFGLNICSELWAVETYAAYAEQGVQVVFSPRATGSTTTEKWIAAGTVAAVRSGAFSVSSNRVDPTGTYGGVGWVISPDGEVLARTSAAEPFVTMEIDLAIATAAKRTYPRNVFGDEGFLSS